MNIYSDDLYAAVQEDYAVYNTYTQYNDRKYKKNSRRAQRKAKQQRREAYWDTF